MAEHGLRNRIKSSAACRRLLDTWRDLRFGRQLKGRQRRIRLEDRCIVFCRVRNAMPRMDFFHAHYKALGVDHFVFIDNGSTDGFADWAADRQDVSVWHTDKSHKAAGFGAYWYNYLLGRIGRGRLCVTVGPDEMLVYPFMETRSLKDLGQFMRETGQAGMGALTLDAYGDRPAAETVLEPGQNPFDLCPFFDAGGYVQKTNAESGTLIQGGPRLRAFYASKPKDAPALNRIPVVWWRKGYRYESGGRSMRPHALNRMTGKGGILLSACLFRFAFVVPAADAAASRRPESDRPRRKRDREALEKTVFADGLSMRYEGTAQLVALGLMNQGEWL